VIDNLIVVPLLAAVAFLTVSYFANSSTIIIQEISVTEEMQGHGLTGEVVTEMLSSSIDKVSTAAGTNRGTLVSLESARSKSVEALSDSFGLRKPIRAAQIALGWLPYTFDGVFLKKDDGLRFRLHGVSPSYSEYKDEFVSETGDVEMLVREAAISILQSIDPYLIAVYTFRQESEQSKARGTPDYTETKEAIAHALIHEDRDHLPWVYALWGAVYYAEGDYEAAIIRYRQALKLDPTFPRPMMRWGQALAALGRHDEAIGRYKATLAIDPLYPEALVLWGQSLIAKGEIEQARVMYQRAAAMAPDFPRIVHAYGMFESQYGNKLVAADYLRRAVELEGIQGRHNELGSSARYRSTLHEIQREIDPAIGDLVPSAIRDQ